MKRNIALITGATGGIGQAFTRELSARGFDLVITARRVERLQEIKQKMESQFFNTVYYVQSDLSQVDGVDTILAEIEKNQLTIDILINNAGYGYQCDFVSKSWVEWERLIHVNVISLVKLTHGILPGMIERKKGKILNIASAAAFQPIPWFTIYAATKAFIRFFSVGLSMEVKKQNIKVSCLCPGVIYSEFVESYGLDVSHIPDFLWMNPERAVNKALNALEKNKFQYIPGLFFKTIPFVERFAPENLVTWISGRLLKPE